MQEYVTCREGDVRRLPFGDNYFDVVVSAVFLHTVGKEYGQKTVEAAAGEDESARRSGESVETRRRRSGLGPCTRARVCEAVTGAEDGGD